MLGRICLSGKLTEVSDEVRAIVKKGVAFYRNLVEIIRDGETTLIDTDEIKSLRHPCGVIRLMRKSADGKRVACYAMAYGDNARTAQFGARGYRIECGYGNAPYTVENGTLNVKLGKKHLSAAVVILKED